MSRWSPNDLRSMPLDELLDATRRVVALARTPLKDEPVSALSLGVRKREVRTSATVWRLFASLRRIRRRTLSVLLQ